MLKSTRTQSRGWIGANQHEEIVRWDVYHGELIFYVVLCLMHGYHSTEDILFYIFNCKVAIYGRRFSQEGRPVDPQERITRAFFVN